AIQAYGIAAGLEGMRSGAQSAVIDPGYFFRFVTMITLTGGTVFFVLLGVAITARRVGDGLPPTILGCVRAHLPPPPVPPPRPRPPGRSLPRFHLLVPGGADRGGRRHRLKGAGAAPHSGPTPKTPAGQPHPPGRGVASPAKAHPLGRNPADLRLFALAAA